MHLTCSETRLAFELDGRLLVFVWANSQFCWSLMCKRIVKSCSILFPFFMMNTQKLWSYWRPAGWFDVIIDCGLKCELLFWSKSSAGVSCIRMIAKRLKRKQDCSRFQWNWGLFELIKLFTAQNVLFTQGALLFSSGWRSPKTSLF